MTDVEYNLYISILKLLDSVEKVKAIIDREQKG